jgi:hypothetical protein
MKIDVHTNIQQVLAGMESYRREVVNKAVSRALNRCAEMARTDAARELRRAGYRLKSSSIKAAISITKASTGSLVATLLVNRKPVPLIQWEASQTSAGVSVRVTGSRKSVKHAFIATMASGHRGVYMRAPGAKHKKVFQGGKPRWSGLPITELFGPSIGGAYASDKVQAASGNGKKHRRELQSPPGARNETPFSIGW